MGTLSEAMRCLDLVDRLNGSAVVDAIAGWALRMGRGHARHVCTQEALAQRGVG